MYTTLIGSLENQNLAINSLHLDYNYPPLEIEYKECLKKNSHYFESTYEALEVENNSSTFDLLVEGRTFFNHFDQSCNKYEDDLQIIDPTLSTINLKMESSSFHGLTFLELKIV